MTQTREAFLAERKTGVGGSDSAAIAGCNPWKSGLDVYLEKLGLNSENGTSDAAQRGIDLEPALLAAYETKTGRMLEGVELIRHPQHPELFCHLDGRCVREPKRIIEAKTARNADDWERGVPTHYNLQGLHSAACTEAEIVDFPVLIAPEEAMTAVRAVARVNLELAVTIILELDFRIYTVERDEEMCEALVASGVGFWRDHVLAKVPPAVRSVEDAKKLWPRQLAGKEIEATEQIAAIEAELRTCEANANAAEAVIEKAKAALMAFMGDAELLTFQGQKLRTWKVIQKKGYTVEPSESRQFKKAGK